MGVAPAQQVAVITIHELLCILNAVPNLLNDSFLALANGSQLPNTLDQLLIVQVRLLALCCQLSGLLCRCAETLIGKQIL